MSEKATPLFAKKLEAFGKKTFEDLKDTLLLNKKPTLGVKAGESIILQEDEDEKSFLKRVAKHAKASSALPALKGRKDNVDITIVSKEVDGKGIEYLKSETINYKVDLSNVAKAKNVDRPGAQLLALKKTLKDKIFEKRRAERELKKKQQNEDEEIEEGFASGEEDEELLDDDEEEELESESEGESEPPESDEDTYVNSERQHII